MLGTIHVLYYRKLSKTNTRCSEPLQYTAPNNDDQIVELQNPIPMHSAQLQAAQTRKVLPRAPTYARLELPM